MITISRRDTFPLTIAILALAFLGLFLLYPLFNVFSASFLDRSGKIFTFGNYARILSSSFYLGSLSNSLILGVLSTLLTIAIGVPLAFCLARLPIPGKSALLALASLPLVLPSFVAAYALVLLLGRAGIVTRFLRDIGIPFTSIYGVTGMTIVLPPHSSGTNSWSASCCFTSSGLALALSILFIATMIGTRAAFAWAIASLVCGITPSSAATTRTTISAP